MATILAHIQIQPGKELEFETLVGELFEATAQEPGKRHYEYWRSAEPGLYYCLLAFDDFHGFLVSPDERPPREGEPRAREAHCEECGSNGWTRCRAPLNSRPPRCRLCRRTRTN